MILICGGAGYIGSHMAQWLYSQGHEVAILDNFSTGHRQAVKWGELIEVDLRDFTGLSKAFAKRNFDSVMHFGASSLVGESMSDPYTYYSNNVLGTLNLLQVMRESNVDRIVFSSTAAIFGKPQNNIIDENHPQDPISPYGASKLMVERILSDAARAYGLRSVSLRYFNAAGALPEYGIGEAHRCETHLIPNVLLSALSSKSTLKVFGDDYDTPDGTCIRDYVHVQDLAQAHSLALELMEKKQGAHTFNLGNGTGFSVREVITAASKIVGKNISFEMAPRRDGDPARLVASSELSRKILGWKPTWTELPPIIESAWRWHRNQPAWN